MYADNLMTVGSCKTCPSGSYTHGGTSNLTREQCSPCPNGMACAGDGSRVLCAPGTYAMGRGNPSCKTCPAGKYGDDRGQGRCTLCAAGQYQHHNGSTFCNACPQGKALVKGRCEGCPAGFSRGNPTSMRYGDFREPPRLIMSDKTKQDGPMKVCGRGCYTLVLDGDVTWDDVKIYYGSGYIEEQAGDNFLHVQFFANGTSRLVPSCPVCHSVCASPQCASFAPCRAR